MICEFELFFLDYARFSRNRESLIETIKQSKFTGFGLQLGLVYS